MKKIIKKLYNWINNISKKQKGAGVIEYILPPKITLDTGREINLNFIPKKINLKENLVKELGEILEPVFQKWYVKGLIYLKTSPDSYASFIYLTFYLREYNPKLYNPLSSQSNDTIPHDIILDMEEDVKHYINKISSPLIRNNYYETNAIQITPKNEQPYVKFSIGLKTGIICDYFV